MSKEGKLFSPELVTQFGSNADFLHIFVYNQNTDGCYPCYKKPHAVPKSKFHGKPHFLLPYAPNFIQGI